MKRIIYLLIFLEGFLVMGVELSSSLVLKPFFGSSLEVWTFILGITMFSLACGYFSGSWLSQKKDPGKILYYLFLLLTLSIYLVPFISKSLFRSLMDYEVTTILLLSVLPFLFPPLLLLGAISTLIVKNIREFGLNEGESASRVYTISTLAGIVSLFITAFVFVEKMQTNTIIFVLSLLAFLGAVLIFITLKKGKYMFLAGLIYVVMGFYFFTRGIEKITDEFPRHVREIYNSDGILGQIMVLKDFNAKTKMLMVNNSVQTTTDFQSRGYFIHVRDIADFLTKTGKKGTILIAGLGGGSLVHELNRPENKMDVVELDKRMLDVCREHFYLPENKNIRYIVDDARHYFNTNSKKYDVIILDLSIGETIPSNVYTLETFQKIKKSLKKDGVLLLNFFSKDTQTGLKAVYALGNTIHQTGMDVSLLNRKKDSVNMSSFVFCASVPGSRKPADSLVSSFPYQGGVILRDNESKLDKIHRDIIIEQRKNYIFGYQNYFESLK